MNIWVKSPALDRIYFKVFPQIFISILLAILILYRMLHFRVPKAESLLTIHLSKSNSRICGSLDHFAGTEQIRVTPQTLKQRFQKIIQAVGSFLAPLYDKIMVYLEPYLATYRKNAVTKRKKKKLHESKKRRTLLQGIARKTTILHIVLLKIMSLITENKMQRLIQYQKI